MICIFCSFRILILIVISSLECPCLLPQLLFISPLCFWRILSFSNFKPIISLARRFPEKKIFEYLWHATLKLWGMMHTFYRFLSLFYLYINWASFLYIKYGFLCIYRWMLIHERQLFRFYPYNMKFTWISRCDLDNVGLLYFYEKSVLSSSSHEK